ncbi:nitrile hydratase subunit beta [Cognatishimia maritima]|uniref:Nitrile hydratase subunit beta n=1 Tax=Cognatishimia maritima TaxID=870908 RepID=A0A1M5TZJ4_9RHOB|nr:nitrile hydratase subunit beta [Cognatishimia maritima]SHH56030.1 nitrile hydratase [Cognatishimia maritima]
MSRVHDMGGRFGDGPITPEDEAVFEKDWHGHALALNLASGALGQWNIDMSRHARECLSPKDYSRFSYYEKWMAGLADLLVEKGLVSEVELETATASGPYALAERQLKGERVAAVLSSGGPSLRENTELPRFNPGQAVQTRTLARNEYVEGGHTRLPAYAAGKTGHVVLCHGAHVLPDTNAHGLGENPEPLYAVAFPAQSLWGDAAAEGDEVILDIWQSYLSPA